jgi:hypothetical protein
MAKEDSSLRRWRLARASVSCRYVALQHRFSEWLPGHRRTIDFISKSKSVARTSEECKAERSTMSSTARLRCAATGCAAFTSLKGFLSEKC